MTSSLKDGAARFFHMMCVVTGRERTEEEYAALFGEAGWNYVKASYRKSKLVGLLEAVKA
jgi:hypothetical protein